MRFEILSIVLVIVQRRLEGKHECRKDKKLLAKER